MRLVFLCLLLLLGGTYAYEDYKQYTPTPPKPGCLVDSDQTTISVEEGRRIGDMKAKLSEEQQVEAGFSSHYNVSAKCNKEEKQYTNAITDEDRSEYKKCQSKTPKLDRATEYCRDLLCTKPDNQMSSDCKSKINDRQKSKITDCGWAENSMCKKWMGSLGGGGGGEQNGNPSQSNQRNEEVDSATEQILILPAVLTPAVRALTTSVS